MPTLAEIVAEGEHALTLRGQITPAVTDEWQMFLLVNGPRLLAVAQAAVEMREAERAIGEPTEPYPIPPRAVHVYGCPGTKTGAKAGACSCGGDAVESRIAASRAAFDAAVRGEEDHE